MLEFTALSAVVVDFYTACFISCIWAALVIVIPQALWQHCKVDFFCAWNKCTYKTYAQKGAWELSATDAAFQHIKEAKVILLFQALAI